MPNVVGFTIQASTGNSDQVLNQLKQSVGSLESALGSAGQVASGFLNSLSGGVAGGILVADSLKKVGQAAADMAGNILDAGRALQDSTAQLQAWGNLTAEQASKVSQAFINMGQPIEQSAAQLTQALANVIPQLEIINQGALSAGQAVAFMSAANDAAVATGQKLEDVTRGLSQAMLTFGVSLSDAKEAAGTLVATSELTGSSIEQITTNIGRLHDRFGPLAPDLKDTASFLEELNQAGASGSRGLLVAATSIDHLLGSSKDTKLGLEELGVSITDNAGKTKGWAQLFPEVVAALSGVTDDAKRMRLENETLGGSWEALDQVVRRGTQGIADANGVVTAHSDADKQAAERANTFSGQLEILGKNAENVAAQLGGIVAGPGTDVLRWLNDAIKGFGDLNSAFGTGLKNFETSGVVDTLDKVIGKIGEMKEALKRTGNDDVPVPPVLKKIEDGIDAIGKKYNDLPDPIKALLAGGPVAGIPAAVVASGLGQSSAPTQMEVDLNKELAKVMAGVTSEYKNFNTVAEQNASDDVAGATSFQQVAGAAGDAGKSFNFTEQQWVSYEQSQHAGITTLQAVLQAMADIDQGAAHNGQAYDDLKAKALELANAQEEVAFKTGTAAAVLDQQGKTTLAEKTRELEAAQRGIETGTSTPGQVDAAQRALEVERAREQVAEQGAQKQEQANQKAEQEAKATNDRIVADQHAANKAVIDGKELEAQGYLQAIELEKQGDAEGAKSAIDAGQEQQQQQEKTAQAAKKAADEQKAALGEIFNLPTQQEKGIQVDQSKLQQLQSTISLQREQVQLQRDVNDAPLDRAIQGETLLKDKFEASLQPLRNQLDVLDSINTVLQDRASLAQDTFTAGGSGVASAQLQLERDSAEANGTLTPELEKQFKVRSDALRVAQDQNQVTQAGFQQAEAAGRIGSDRVKIALDTATAEEKTTQNINGQLTVLGQQKQIRQDTYAIADAGNKIADAGRQIEQEKLGILQQQLSIVKELAQSTQESALATYRATGQTPSQTQEQQNLEKYGLVSGSSGGSAAPTPNRIGVPSSYPASGAGKDIGKQALTVNLQLNSASIGKAAADEIYNDLTLQVGTAP